MRFFLRAQSITRLLVTPPAPAPGRDGLALVLIVRNEARHIGEWARFHALAGVSHFYVYDNGSTDGTVDAIQVAVPGRVTVMPWDQKLRDGRFGFEIHNQVLAYAHALRNFGGRYRWLSFLDVDEFLIPTQDASLPEALAALEGCANISLPWHMFGRSGHGAAPEGGVLANYTRRMATPQVFKKGISNFKMIVDPCKVTSIKVHEIEVEGTPATCNDKGEGFTNARRKEPGFYSNARIQLNHYYTRSDAELRAKISRGPNLTTPDAAHVRRVLRKVDQIERAEVEDTAVRDYFARIGVADWC